MFRPSRSCPILWLAALMVVLVVQTVPLYAQPAITAWPMWGQNAQRTGEGLFSGPLGPVPILKWTADAGTLSDGIVIGPTALYFNGFGLMAVNFDGTPKWRWPSPTGGAAAVAANGTLYVPTYDWGLYAIDPEGLVNPDGKLDASAIKWNIPASTFGTFVGGPLLIDNAGCIFANTGLMKIMDAGDHAEIVWARGQAGGNFAVALDDNGTPNDTSDDVLFVASGTSSLSAIRSSDGATVWTRNFKDSVNSPAVGSDGTVYLTTMDSILWALNPDTGATKWQATLGKKKSLICSSRPSVDNSAGIVYCAGQDTFYAFNENTGKVKWMKSLPPTGVGPGDSKPAIGLDGTVYWCDRVAGTLYAMSPSNGVTLWTATGGYAHQDPVIDIDGTLYVGSSTGVSAYQDP